MRISLCLASALPLAMMASAAAASPPAPVPAPIPAYATPLFDAYFGIGVGYGWENMTSPGLSSSSVTNNGFAVQGRASFEGAITDRFGIQFDGVVGHDARTLKAGGGFTPDSPMLTASVATHLFWRDPSVGLFGAIGQYSTQHFEFDFDDGFKEAIDFDSYYAGVEGQLFLNMITLYGQLAYHKANLSIGSSFDGDGVTVAGQVRYFVMPDWSIAAKGSYDRVSFDLPFAPGEPLKQTSWTAGLRSEYRLAAMPASFYGELTHGEKTLEGVSLTPGGSLTTKDTRAMIGVQYSLGGRTLQDRDRAGASLDPFDQRFAMFPMP